MEKPKIKIIIAGSRKFSDFTTMTNIIDHILNLYVYRRGFYENGIEIICGMAKGADLLGKQYAEQNGYDVKCFPANWDLYGKSAGFIRNKQMAEYASSIQGYGALIVFWDGSSKGTKNMIELAKEYNLKTFVYNYVDSTQSYMS